MFSQAASAMRLGFLHFEMLDEAFWGGLTAHSDAAAILLDEDGRIIRVNDGAEAILARGDGLIAIEGKLESKMSSDGSRLNNAISGAIGKSGLSATVSIGRASGRSPYIMIVYPLVWARRSLAPSEAAALVRVIDPARQTPDNATILRQAFDLTAREAEFAALLLGGHSVESAAFTLGIAMPTARIHVRNLLAKTGTTSQAGFMRVASGLR